MSATPNKGKIRVAIDWGDVGIPSFFQSSGDTLNLIPHAPFIASMLKYVVAPDGDYFTKLPPDTPIGNIQTFPFFGLNPYGAEILEMTGTANGINMTVGTDSTNFTIPVTGSTEYTLWVWYAADTNYTNDSDHDLTVIAFEVDGSNAHTQSTNTLFDVTDDWAVKPVCVHFTTDPDSTHVTIWTVKADTDDTFIDLFMLGAMLVAGDYTSQPPTYNAGSTLGYLDEITNYYTAITGKIGKTQWESPLFDEGTLSITLNNDTKLFSPENTDSPLFGSMKPYLKVWVLAGDSNDVYHLLWSGFTQQFAVEPGVANSRTATIQCRQGLFAIQAQDPNLLNAASEIQSIDAIKLLFAGGFNIPTGTDDTTQTPNYIMDQNALNGNAIPIFGVDFVGKTDKRFDTELGYISELNGNYLFLNRYGRIFFSSWDYIKGLPGDPLDYRFTTQANYIYSPQDLFRQIIVNYNVYDSALFGVEMEGQEVVISAGASDYPFSIFPTYNGMPFIGNVVLDVSSFIPVDSNRVATSGSGGASFTEIVQGIYTYYTSLASNTETDGLGGVDLRLSLVSRASDHVWFAIETNKQYIAAGYDAKSLDTVSYNNPLITTDGDAETFGDMQVDRRANVFGWFTDATLMNKSDDVMNFILAHTLGDVVNITEEQTGSVEKALAIIGETFVASPTLFQMQYTFAPTGRVVDIVEGLVDDDSNPLTDDDGNTLTDDS